MPVTYQDLGTLSAGTSPTSSEGRLAADAALVIVDLQKAFDDPRYRPRNNPEAEANIARLLAAWRETGRPVIHVQHLSREADSPYRPGQPGCDFKDEVRPQAGELVVQKSTNSAFVDTGLGPYLEDKGIRTLVITGVATNNSVETTARMAGNLGYETYVVADATATADRTDLAGRVWRAEEIQALTLANLQGEYATVA
ncbi:MAG: cysteine hydrolase family protein, partial [Kiloniellales bacterium]|nr:cysteine hydrolase family protein [Kiloniellales bacterium]